MRTPLHVQREARWAWLKWSPIPILAFSVLFYDAWLNVRCRENDYRLGELRSRIEQLQQEHDRLRLDLAREVPLQELSEEAERMGLTPPDPGQIISLRVPGEDVERVSPEPPFVFAERPDAP